MKIKLSHVFLMILLLMSKVLAMNNQEIIRLINTKVEHHEFINKSREDNPSIPWQALNGPQMGARIQTLALQKQSRLLFAFRPGTKGQLYRSNDAGKHWDALPSPSNTILYDLAEIDADHLILGTHSGLYLSDDLGTHWRKVKTMTHPVNNIFVAHRNLILILTDRYLTTANLYRSLDGGKTWTPARLGLNTRQSIWTISGRKNILFASADGLNVSLNGGQFWTQFEKWKNYPILSIAVDSKYTVYIATGELYKTDAAGQFFKKINPAIKGEIESIKVDAYDQLYAVIREIDAKQSGLYRSSDEGKTWKLLHIFKRIDNFIVLNNNKILITTNKGLMLSDQQQSNFHLLANTFSTSEISDVFALDKDHLFAIDTDYQWSTLKNILYRSKDGGKTWIKSYKGYACNIVTFNNQLILAADRNLILTSQDKGETWKIIYQFNDHHQHVGLSQQNNALVLLRTDGQYISYNLLNWKKINNDFYDENNMLYLNEMNWIYMNADNIIQYSMDEGNTWYPLLHDLHARGLISGYHSNLLVAAFIDAGVIKSIDGGLHWEFINDGLNNFHFRKLKVIDEDHYYLASEQGIFVTQDGGKHWTAENSGLANKDVLSLFIKDKLLLIGTNGSGVFKGRL